MTVRVVLYARVSTDMQAEEGLSIPAQINEMHEFVERRGWTIVGEFIDPGYSGSSMYRPGLQGLIQAVEQGNCEVMLVHELSRLSRSIFDTFRIFEQLGEGGVGFASVKDPDFDFSTPQGRLFLTMLSAINQYYLDLLKQHTAKGKRQRARQGLYNASIIPHGYKNIGDAQTPPEIEEKEAEAIVLAFQTYATGTASYQDVADRLNEAGYRTRKGKRFGKDTIDDMLRNPFYTGKIVYGTKHKGQEPEIFEGQHEAIISMDLFESCQRIRKKRRGTVRSYQSKFRIYLLNAISVCSVCGRDLRAQGTPTNRYYREMSRARGYVDCPNAQRGVVAAEIESQVENIFRYLELPPDWQEELESILDRESELEALNNRRARLKAELRRLQEMNIKGQFEDDPRHFDQEYARIRRELDALPTSDLRAIEEAAKTLTHLAEVWDEADMETKRDLIRLVLSQVEVDVQQTRVVSVTPYAPFLPLFRHAQHLVEVDRKFIPLWSPELAEQIGPDPLLPPLNETPSPKNALCWPEIIGLPEPSPLQRITPILSSFLKARRKANTKVTGEIIEIPHPAYPPLQLDTRKWPDHIISQVTTSRTRPPKLDIPDEGASFIYTPFVLQCNTYQNEWLAEMIRLLEPAGWWVLQEMMPASMPGHWLYQYFPEGWHWLKQQSLTPSLLYAVLQQQGLEVKMEQKIYYQPVRPGVALQMARQREAGVVLNAISEEAYQAGLVRLEAESKETNKLLASHICVVEIIACRPKTKTKCS